MKTRKQAKLALNILVHSKLRSWLTIIGIVIGIASVVAILSMSHGAQQELQSRLSGLGANVLTVSPGHSRAMGFPGAGGGRFSRDNTASSTTDQKNLTEKDVLVIKTVPGVTTAMGTISGQADMVYNAKTASVNIEGVDPQVWKDITTETLSSGRMLTIGDKNSVVIGESIANDVFSGIELNRQVTIGGKNFRVVGIISNSRSIYMPIDQARIALDLVGSDNFDSISVKVDDTTDTTALNNTITTMQSKLMLERGILNTKNIDFSISNPAEIQATMTQTLNSMALFLGAIAAIALLVGGIGIANTMFTSVLEKTHEIGIMKAIGAKNKDILAIFLMNAGMIGLVGGLGGILLGMIGSSFITSMISGGMGISRMFGAASISIGLVVVMFLFSIVIGMIAGVIPAYRASRLKPVDALRYE